MDRASEKHTNLQYHDYQYWSEDGLISNKVKGALSLFSGAQVTIQKNKYKEWTNERRCRHDVVEMMVFSQVQFQVQAFIKIKIKSIFLTPP